ncbi:ESS family glutamate:Na+ symporter [Halopolyspora algeriensis]|uniref:ESS family glutamate:Na+ symporter n=1 Tax=Halopolyspora algeriensis TaxID=1500506 RepID=A0A368VWQ6_9ACTN|nr:sodium:glutamate symporter [Halopolyspora algeriensis]RCW45737.1 ESS family glutamate:Na+ symporter [Halopolyspora algeriensis]TQM54121.1 ESS family glutamate:Na+ symporter [Halopolyspora algeriensis]
MSADNIGFALLLLGVLLLVAKLVRVKWRLAQRLFLPGSIIGGAIALLLGPDVFGNIASALGTDRFTEGGLFGSDIQQVWSSLPGLLISVVFAGLFLGQKMPKMREAGRLAGPQIAFGLTLSSGQYVVGLLLALLLLSPVFGLPPLSGALIEIGFEGGHGTAAGLGNTFSEVGFPAGQDLALGMATIGLISGIVLGIVLINWGVRSGRTTQLRSDATPSVAERMGLVEKENRRAAATLTVHPSSIEPLALHFGLLAVAIIIGQLLLWGLQALENMLWVETIEIFGYVPLFPLAMLGGILLQFVIDRFDRAQIVDRLMIERIQGFALDMLIIAALGTLSLEVIANNIVPFLLLAGCGLIWCAGAFLLLAPRMLPDHWFERGIGDFGQSMGVTATGLILMRIADPELRTPAYPAFGYKQLIVEPFFGGGLVTASAIPLIAQFGAVPLLIVMAVLLVAALLTGLLYFGRRPAPSTPETALTRQD